ncbi:hypothetical protein IW262DRAFT_1405879 [Armillaria fumosa]|nr:hypothetical protein IW262DRAFT_1405879 [Armillaria fumosa]
MSLGISASWMHYDNDYVASLVIRVGCSSTSLLSLAVCTKRYATGTNFEQMHDQQGYIVWLVFCCIFLFIFVILNHAQRDVSGLTSNFFVLRKPVEGKHLARRQ